KLRTSLSAARIGGTLLYMAPEQLDAFDRRAGPGGAGGDLFAFGVILFELRNGRRAVPGGQGPCERRSGRRRAGPPTSAPDGGSGSCAVGITGFRPPSSPSCGIASNLSWIGAINPHGNCAKTCSGNSRTAH